MQDPSIRPLLSKVVVTVDPKIESRVPEIMMVRVVARLANGMIHKVENINPPGHPANPMTEEDIAQKFRAQSVPVIGEERSFKVVNAWSKLASVPDIRPLIKMMDIP